MTAGQTKTYMQSTTQFTITSQLDIDALRDGQADEVEWFCYGAERGGSCTSGGGRGCCRR